MVQPLIVPKVKGLLHPADLSYLGVSRGFGANSIAIWLKLKEWQTQTRLFSDARRRILTAPLQRFDPFIHALNMSYSEGSWISRIRSSPDIIVRMFYMLPADVGPWYWAEIRKSDEFEVSLIYPLDRVNVYLIHFVKQQYVDCVVNILMYSPSLLEFWESLVEENFTEVLCESVIKWCWLREPDSVRIDPLIYMGIS